MFLGCRSSGNQNDGAVDRPEYSGLGFFADSGYHFSGRNHPALCVHADIVTEKGRTHTDSGQVSEFVFKIH